VTRTAHQDSSKVKRQKQKIGSREKMLACQVRRRETGTILLGVVVVLLAVLLGTGV
jgi:hypothetical protein